MRSHILAFYCLFVYVPVGAVGGHAWRYGGGVFYRLLVVVILIVSAYIVLQVYFMLFFRVEVEVKVLSSRNTNNKEHKQQATKNSAPSCLFSSLSPRFRLRVMFFWGPSGPF